MTQSGKNEQSIKIRMWKYFAVFTMLILCLLWILQIILFGTFYKTMKGREMRDCGNEIKTACKTLSSEQIAEYIERKSFEQGISIYAFDKDGNVLSTRKRPRPEWINEDEKSEVYKVLENRDEAIYRHTEQNFKMNVASYATKIYDADGNEFYLYMKSPLLALNSTAKILRTQFFIVSVLSLAIALVLSYFTAKRFTQPIVKITETANELAAGNYDAHFDGGGFREIEDLADTLNFASSELKKTDELRRDLLSNVSHDLKTPLTIIKSYAEMVRDLSGENKEKRNEHLSVIIDETDRLTYLVGDILDLSKMEANIDTLEREKVDLKEIVNSVLKNFAVLEQNEGYEFITEIEPDCVIFADYSKIYQVVYNLLNNAVNYTGDDKTVKIRITQTGGKVLFEVIDTGDGIAPDKIDKVWDRYYKTGKNHKRGVNGTGIGLSIVKNILILHGAEYGVKSEVGHGSDFWFKM